MSELNEGTDQLNATHSQMNKKVSEILEEFSEEMKKLKTEIQTQNEILGVLKKSSEMNERAVSTLFKKMNDSKVEWSERIDQMVSAQRAKMEELGQRVEEALAEMEGPRKVVENTAENDDPKTENELVNNSTFKSIDRKRRKKENLTKKYLKKTSEIKKKKSTEDEKWIKSFSSRNIDTFPSSKIVHMNFGSSSVTGGRQFGAVCFTKPYQIKGPHRPKKPFLTTFDLIVIAFVLIYLCLSSIWWLTGL